MNRRHRTSRSVTLAVALALAVTALCVPALSAPASAATTPVVTIGVIAPVDGGLVEFGRGIRDSVTLAVNQANARNAVKGWTVKVRVIDDSSDPAKGAQAAATLAQDPSVAAVVGPYNSGVALAAAPVLDAQGLALVSPSNTLTSLTVGNDVAHPTRQWKRYFRLVGPDSRQAEFLAARARALGFKSAAVVSETKAVSKGLADEFVTAFKAGGGTVTVQQVLPDGATDFSAFVTAAVPAKPDLMFFGGEYNVAATLRSAATASGLTVPLMGGDGMNDPAYITGAGAAAAGSYASGVGVPLASLDGSAKFLAAYQAAGFASRPTDYGPYAYDATNTVIDVLANALKGTSTIPAGLRAAVVSGIQHSRRTGLTGVVRFDKYGDTVKPGFTLYRVSGAPAAWTPLG